MASAADSWLVDPRVGCNKAYITTLVCNRHLAYSGSTSCYKRCWATLPGIPLHLRQGVLLGHSGREGVSSRIIFE